MTVFGNKEVSHVFTYESEAFSIMTIAKIASQINNYEYNVVRMSKFMFLNSYISVYKISNRWLLLH